MLNYCINMILKHANHKQSDISDISLAVNSNAAMKLSVYQEHIRFLYNNIF